MKSKFSSGWRVAVALVLVLSLGMVFAAPAVAGTTCDYGTIEIVKHTNPASQSSCRWSIVRD